MMNKISIALAATASAATLAACGSSSDQSKPVADPMYVFDSVQSIRDGETLDAVQPLHLAEALPNRTIVFQTDIETVRVRWSDLVVIGEVIDVKPGDALAYEHLDPADAGNEESGMRSVPFDDPEADSWNVLVTVQPTWTHGDPVSDTVEFRMGVLGGSDPDEFMASLRGLTEVAVVLASREDGRHEGDYYPIMGGALLGEVGSDGALSFPGLGPQQARFLGEIDTVEELRSQSQAPEQAVER